MAPLICACLACGVSAAEPFRFSVDAEKERANDQAAEARRAQEIQQLVSAPCQRRLKNRKILQLIGGRTTTGLLTKQDRYAPLFRVIDARLQALGLKTYTQEQIRQNIAQAEVDAYFKNDPDAALAASKRLAADYVLRGSISTRAGVNPVVQVKEVAVNIELTLSAADGRFVQLRHDRSRLYSAKLLLGAGLNLAVGFAHSQGAHF